MGVSMIKHVIAVGNWARSASSAKQLKITKNSVCKVGNREYHKRMLNLLKNQVGGKDHAAELQ